MSEIVSDILAQFPIERLAAEGAASPDAAEASRDLKTAIGGIVSAGEGYRVRRAELRETGHTMPPHGLQLEQQRARKEAEQQAELHGFDAKRALARLKSALTESALPRIDPAREQLARQELDAALNDGDPEARALDVATNGSREAVAALFTTYGETKLRAAGVKDPARILAEAKNAAAAVAVKRGATVRETGSAGLLRGIGQLGSATQAARSILNSALYEDDAAAARELELQDRADEMRIA